MATDDLTRSRRMDATKVSISAAVKGTLILVVGIMEMRGLSLGPTALLSTAAVLELLALAAIPDNIYERIGRRLVGGNGSLPPSEPPTAGPPIAFILFLSLLLPGEASATDARIPLVCTSTATVLREISSVGVREETECVDPTEWLDLAVGVNVFALQLTGPREVVSLGASPALGMLYAWRPAGWTATPFLLGAELTLAMTLISPAIVEGEATHVEIWTIAGLDLLGYLSIGIGGRFGLAVREGSDDFARLVLAGGLRMPI